MNADEHRLREAAMKALSERIIGCAFPVSNTLGCGFLEKVYENAAQFRPPRVEIKRDRR